MELKYFLLYLQVLIKFVLRIMLSPILLVKVHALIFPVITQVIWLKLVQALILQQWQLQKTLMQKDKMQLILLIF